MPDISYLNPFSNAAFRTRRFLRGLELHTGILVVRIRVRVRDAYIAYETSRYEKVTVRNIWKPITVSAVPSLIKSR